MQTVGLPPQSTSVAFGQLLGMKDFITLGLAKHGFNVHKCAQTPPAVYTRPPSFTSLHFNPTTTAMHASQSRTLPLKS